MQAQVAGLSQPQLGACWKPSTLSPMPTTISAAPRPVDRLRGAVAGGCRP